MNFSKFLLLCLFSFILQIPTTAHATDVGGTISSNTTWTLSGSPYIITEDLLIDNGAALTIEPGVTVQFNNYSMIIDGTLIARGTANRDITFTSNQIHPQLGDWRQIKFRNSSVDAVYNGNGNYISGCIMEYCTVEYAGGEPDLAAVLLDNASPFIAHTQISDNSSCGIHCINSASPKIDNCVITNSKGIHCENSSSPLIINCVILDNNSCGVYCDSFSSPFITDCLIINNHESGIHCQASSTPVIKNCTISGNYSGGIYGESLNPNGTNPLFTVNNSSIIFNKSHGVSIYPFTTWAPSFQAVNIFGNAGSDIRNLTGEDISCTGAYWGTTNTSEISAQIYDYFDNPSYGEVIYAPFAGTSNSVEFRQYISSPGKYLFGEAELEFSSIVGADTFRITVYHDTYPPNLPSTGMPLKKKFVLTTDPGISSFNGSLTLWYAQEEFDNSDISGESTMYCALYEEGIWYPYESSVDFKSNRVSCDISSTGIWGIGGQDGSLPVVLSSFTAQNLNEGIILEWSTESEVDNLGFHIYRSLEENGFYDRITTELIPGAGNTTTPQFYSYNDRNITCSETYWYKLEDMDLDGVCTMHGPISITANNDNNTTPKDFLLFQNYPNPFNNSTIIKYELPVQAIVSLVIYNQLGQKVRTLVQGEQPADFYKKSWDGRDDSGQELGNGIYVYVFKAGSLVESRKILYLK